MKDETDGVNHPYYYSTEKGVMPITMDNRERPMDARERPIDIQI